MVKILAPSALLIIFVLLLEPMKSFASQSGKVSKKFESDNTTEEEDSFFESITSAFDTPVLRGGVQAGTKAINQSIENVMDALFYQLMDNKWVLAREGDLNLNLESERKIYTSPTGDFVVADRISIGPEYSKSLGETNDIPVSLNVGLNADYYEVYPSSDALRLAESKQDGYLSWSVKNWFGALPILSRILPPSFNPNELYDPTRLVSPPFSIPLDKESFETMPINSIRSYAIRGGINLPFSLDSIVNPELKQRLKSMEDLDLSLPYSIFVSGEYRINVLRKDQHTAWVGLSKTRSMGHGVFGIIGKTIYVLKDWATNIPFDGMPLPFFPLDSDISSDIINTSSVLYEFDLRKETGREAYKKAVIGDFDFSFQKWQRKKKGVIYHFTKQDSKTRARSKQAVELGVFANFDIKNSEEVESDIRDPKGKFHLLESTEKHASRVWDILVGETRNELNTKLTLHVKKIDANDDGSDWMYAYKNIKNPWLFSISARIFDSFTSGIEIKKYKKDIEDISGIKLWGFPKFPTSNTKIENKTKRQRLTSHPYNRTKDSIAPPQLLGRFNSKIELLASTKQLKKLYKNAKKDFYKTYRNILFPDKKLRPKESDKIAALYPTRFINILTSPLRVLGIERTIESREAELNYRTNLLKEMYHISSPKEHQEAFSDLFETDYPKELTSAIVKTVGSYGAPRSVTLYTKAASGLSPGDKLKFNKLNRLRYRRGKKFEYWDRYNVTSRKTSAFKPLNLVKKQKLKISSASIQTNFREVKNENPLPFQLTIKIKGHSNKKVNLYLKFENSGNLDFGRLVLSESVLEKKVATLKGVGRTGHITVNLYDDEEVRTFLLEQAIALGGDIKVSMALSDEKGNWSSIQNLTFTYQDGRLKLLD
jgi:hypothetical protein